MDIRIKAIKDGDSLLKIEHDWNSELMRSANNPFLYSRILCEFVEFLKSSSWTPLILTFLSYNRIVGIVPLKLHSRFNLKYVENLDSRIYSEFFFSDEYRELCFEKMIKYIFSELKCHSACITLHNGLVDHKLLGKICKANGLDCRETQYMGRALIQVENGWEIFYDSLSSKIKKEFQRLTRKLDRMGPWQISNSEINSNSINRILTIERYSWKSRWRAQNNVQNDYKLLNILNASQRNSPVTPIYESKIWFLEVNQLPIAYLLVLIYKEKAIFVKTSYNEKFKQLAPGKYLMIAATREILRTTGVKKIDLITNLPFAKIWKPICENRTTIKIEQHCFLSTIVRFIVANPLISRFAKYAKIMN
ncbi:GNAT family N-acetyltransferase [Candidatus Bathyarchaeota archaeon]|nr:GNAT family N-acetyltransferase [Candidatus Bathyarchaeota archaeon]